MNHLQIPYLQSSLFFRGSYDSSYAYKPGDVIIDGDETKIFTGKEFCVVDSDKSQHDAPKILPKVCTQCGAPVNSLKSRCEYCGCEY